MLKIGLDVNMEMPTPEKSREVSRRPILELERKVDEFIDCLDKGYGSNSEREYLYLTMLYKKLLCMPEQCLTKELCEIGQKITDFLLRTSQYANSIYYIDIEGKDINKFKDLLEHHEAMNEQD